MAGIQLAQWTVQLEQISPEMSARAVGVFFLTPAADGRLLNPCPTFRRLPLDKEPHFPAAIAMLTSEQWSAPLPIRFAAGQERVHWRDLDNLPVQAKDGLPAGRYILSPEKGVAGSFIAFIVEDGKDRQKVLRPIEAMAALMAKRTDPLLLQFELEHLLQFRGENDAPLYLSDALDGLERVPEKELNAHLRRQRLHLIRCLQADPARRAEALIPAVPAGETTGVAELEKVRQWIASSRWREALAELDAAELQKKCRSDSAHRGVDVAVSGRDPGRDRTNTRGPGGGGV